MWLKSLKSINTVTDSKDLYYELSGFYNIDDFMELEGKVNLVEGSVFYPV